MIRVLWCMKVDVDEVVLCHMMGTEDGVDRVTVFPDMGLYPLLGIGVGLLMIRVRIMT